MSSLSICFIRLVNFHIFRTRRRISNIYSLMKMLNRGPFEKLQAVTHDQSFKSWQVNESYQITATSENMFRRSSSFLIESAFSTETLVASKNRS